MLKCSIALCLAVILSIALVWLSSESKQAFPLKFDHTEFDAGVVHEDGILSHTFPFVVTSKETVVVSSIDSSCSCIVTQSDQIGRALHAGDTGWVRLSVKLDRNAGQIKAMAMVVVGPNPSDLISLTLSATARGTPQLLGASPVLFRGEIGRASEVELQYTIHRPLTDQPLEIDAANSSFAPLVFLRDEVTTSSLPPEASQLSSAIRETHRIHLRHPAVLTEQRIEAPCSIHWVNATTVSDVEVVLDIKAKYALVDSQPFIGMSRPGQTREVTFQFDGEPPSEFTVLDKFGVPVAYDRVGDSFRVSFVAPATVGTFKEVFTIRPTSSPMQEIFVHVGGVVRN